MRVKKGRLMKGKTFCVVMLTLILTNMLTMPFITRFSLASNGESTIISEESLGNVSETTLLNEANEPCQEKDLDGGDGGFFGGESDAKQHTSLEGPSRSSQKGEDKWNFNDTNEWINFACVDGNKTRLIVGVNDEKSTSLFIKLEEIVAKHEARIVNTISMGGEVRAVVVELLLGSVTAFVEEIRILELASYIEPNMKVQAQFVPNDPYWNSQWGPQKIEADWAWNTTLGDPSVLVAVVDTGIDYTHPDLAANYVALGYDWVNNDADPIDDSGHGTHCAGIIAAVLNNSIGIAGLAQVQVMAEKVLDSWGSGLWDWVASGIINATDCGCNIISMSLGGYYDSELVHDAVKYAYDAGVLVIAAAGNENTEMKLYPAGYDEVVAVAATDQYDNKAWFSNWGDWIELAAPGVDVYSTVPWGYDYKSGTSMSTPHVAGVAAIVWSAFPNKGRDWVRLWLRCTTDDLGALGFDIYYGYGRVNARKAVEQSPPAHELIAYEWRTPPYVELGALGIINATVLNFGENDETDIMVQLLANGTIADSTLIGFLASGNSTTVNLLWNPTVEGQYNVTLYVVPVPSETSLENNVLWKCLYVGFPVKAVVLHSAGNVFGDIITNWQVLNSEWHLFGDTMVYIDYTTLNKPDITYADIAATGADVLIISCAADPYSGWEFTDSEIEAIKQYVHEEHGLIATAGTLYYWVPNNNKLAPLFGLNKTVMWDATWTDLLHLVNTTHPVFTNVPNPLVFPQVATAIPYDGQWDSNELVGGKYLALGHYQESAIATFRGLVYISPWLEILPAYYHHHLQLLYNAITWSRYQKPEHDLIVSLQCPIHLDPGESVLVNATVENMGLNNESNVELVLLVNDEQVANLTVPTLAVGESETLSYLWVPAEGAYSVTAYAPPVLGEEDTFNNVKTIRTRVSYAVVIGFIETHSETLHSDDLKIFYQSLGQIVNTICSSLTPELLADYDVLIVGEDWYNYPWESSEIAAVHDFILSGGGFVGIGDELAYPVQEILGEYGIAYTGYGGYSGSSNNLDYSHPIMQGVNYIYASYPVNSLQTTPPGYWIANDTYNEYMLIAGAEVGGYVLCMSDDFAAYVYDDDDEIMFANMIYWMSPYEHDLAVSLDVPPFHGLNTSIMVNATVLNRGLNNETDVELYLLINGTVVNSTTISKLLTRESHTISYLWTPTVEEAYNITAYAPPVPDEAYTRNNVASRIVKVRHIIARIAVLNSLEIPHYFTGGWNNNYQTLVDALNAQGFNAQAVTNTEIIGGTLSLFDVFVMVDNVPNEAAVPHVVDFWSIGGGIVAFDSSICFLCYAGILPPESAGNNGYYIYWDYETRNQAKISTTHPITAGYEVGQIVDGTSGDAEYRVEALANTSAFSYYTMLVEDVTRLNRAYVSAYEPLVEGRVVHIWEQNHWSNTNLQLMILNAMEWTKTRYEHDIAVYLAAPRTVEVGSSTILNATVLNRGLKNETGIELYLLINGTVASSAMNLTLLADESYTINYTWTPTNIGNYNITAYAAPLPEEEYVVNNIMTKSVGVFYYTRFYLPHEWVGGGAPMGWHADDYSWQYTLPFDFPFYGIHYRTIYISSNGLITFLEPDSSCSNSLSALADKLAIAPAWDDWVTDDPYDIYIWQNSTHVGIRWWVRHFGTTVTADFEAILRKDGVIQFNYGYNDGAVSATIGISNGVDHIIAEDVTYLNYHNTIIFDIHKHDVAIENVSVHPTQVYAGETVNINVTAINEGTTPEDFTVTVYYCKLTSSSTTASAYTIEGYPGNAMWIEPSTIELYTDTHSVGYRFNITFWINLTVTCGAWEFMLIYNRAYLNATRAAYTAGGTSEFFQGLSTASVSPIFDLLNSTHNYVLYGEAVLGPARVPGYGSLACVELEVMASPPEGETINTKLDISTFYPDETYALEDGDTKIPMTVYDAIYSFTSGVHPPPPPSNVIGTQAVVNLPPNSSIPLTFTWDTAGLQLGSYVINADASVIPGERDIEDNFYTDGTVEILWVHDVSIVNVHPSRTWAFEGRDVQVNVTVKNSGDFTENVTITAYYNLTAHKIIETEEIENLLPNETRTVTLTWNTESVTPCRNYTITAVATIPESDSNPEDNTLVDGKVEIRILGDLNDDGKVDIQDVRIVAKAFGETPERPRWNPDADLNDDGKVDIQDVRIVASNFGRHSMC